ncbi:MAG TPA: hypothetical protein VFS67_33365 [Polyangiaceae bacterium]|jgi:hypothetical protein|nr:hypothetical protein [Polyangiaceae bacterium]
MSFFEQYRVGSTELIGTTKFKLKSLTALAPTHTPVSSILLIKGATSTQNRKGQENGDGSATVYLTSSDFLLAVDHIDPNDIVNYQSDDLSPPPLASIKNFNFPVSEP